MSNNSNQTKPKVSSFPRDTLDQATAVRDGWNVVGRQLSVPNLTVEQFLDKLAEARAYVENAEQLKIERARAVRERNVRLSELWDLTKRIRNAARATFGDSSDELDLLINLKQDIHETE